MFIKRNINKLNAVNNTAQRDIKIQQIVIISNNKIISAQNKKQIKHRTLLKYIVLNYLLNYNKAEASLYYNYLKDNYLYFKAVKAEIIKEQNIINYNYNGHLMHDQLIILFNYKNKSRDELKVIYNSLKGNINYFKQLENKYNMTENNFAHYKLNKMETI